jgi:hypothetical protein
MEGLRQSVLPLGAANRRFWLSAASGRRGHGVGDGAGADGGAGVVGDLAAVLLDLALGRRGLEAGELGDPGGLLVLVLLGVDVVAEARGFAVGDGAHAGHAAVGATATIRSMRPL